MDLSDAYANMAHIPDGAALPAQWQARAAQYRGELGARFHPGFDIETRHGWDLVLPEGTPKGLMVFVHGGYWMATSPRDWTHLARGARAHGWAVALPGYPLCPDVTIAGITRHVTRMVAGCAAELSGPIVLTGHSAGGHLVARVAEALPQDLRARITTLAPLSMLSDLAPLMQTDMNAVLGLNAEEARAESPCHAARPPIPRIALWVGAAERPVFLEQTALQARVWNVTQHILPDLHHFTILDQLEDPQGAVLKWCLSQDSARF